MSADEEADKRPMSLDFASRSHVGERNYQEDSCAFAPTETFVLAVLADGMGGHAAGEIASKLAVENFIGYFLSSNAEEHFRFGSALASANLAIKHSIEQNPAQDGMGCTLTAVLATDEGLHWVSVGDSPLFIFQGGKLSRLNQDHSMAPLIQAALSEGKISQAEADSHPKRNMLRSALMGDEIELIDLSEGPYRLKDGAIVVSASDGLLTLSESQIRDELKKARDLTSAEIAQSLVKAVLQQKRPRQDNVTVQVMKYRGNKRSSALLLISGVVILAMILSGLAFAFRKNLPGWQQIFDSHTQKVLPVTSAGTEKDVTPSVNQPNENRKQSTENTETVAISSAPAEVEAKQQLEKDDLPIKDNADGSVGTRPLPKSEIKPQIPVPDSVKKND